jgi:prepilin-type N-terminal cleavage/methylation domain-containing protein
MKVKGGHSLVGSGQVSGFTLIELLIVVAIIAILAAVALPSYQDYILRGRLTEGTNELAAMRAKMEQYYQDNRTYAATGSYTPPCSTTSTVGFFSVSCDGSGSVSATAYTIVAQGSAIAASFTYTIDEKGTRATTSTKWGTTSTSCWLMKSGESC